jgi:death on curing protein
LNPEFLDIDDVLEMHADQIAEHGGSEGVRNRGLLESALAQPMAQFGGQFLNEDLFEMAAALHISLVSNHPFIDGNKRTALLATLTFLDINGFVIERPCQALTDMTLQVAEGTVNKAGVTKLLRDLVASPDQSVIGP